MILISAGLVLTAIVLLIAGFVLAKPFLVMWSIAVSVLSAVFLVIGALLRRDELFPGGSAGASPSLPPEGQPQAGPVPAPHGMGSPPSGPPHMTAQPGTRQQAPVQPRRGPVPGPATAARRGALAAEAIVLVIPGRKRYHIAGCRQLAGRAHEELTHEEAREEGFTPCTTCLPESPAGSPQQAQPGTREGSGHLTSPHESGAAREPASHEATARFPSPYARPTIPPSGQQQAPVARPEAPAEFQRPAPTAPGAHPEASAEFQQSAPTAPGTRPDASAAGEGGAARREATPRQEAQGPPQEPVIPVARPYVHSSEPQARSEEPTTPPLRAAESPTPSVPIRLPKVPPIPHADSEATSWFNRDTVAQAVRQQDPTAQDRPGTTEATEPDSLGNPATIAAPADRTEAPEPVSPEPAPSRPASSESVSPEPTSSEPTSSGSASSGSTGTEVPGSAGAGEPVETQGEPVASEPVASGTHAGSGAAEDDSTVSEPAARVVAAESPAKPVPSGATVSESEKPAGQEAVGEPEASGRKTSATSDTPEPVEPAETVPGRAGPRESADSTPVESAVTSEETAAEAPAAGPSSEAEDREAGGETVRIIVGTRRFHDPACPLVKGAGDSGIEIVSLAEAEEAGLSGCPVCRNDHRAGS